MSEVQVKFIPRRYIELVAERLQKREPINRQAPLLQLISDCCRVNTLSAVKLAGSGHLGSSFSAMDTVVWLYYRWMNVTDKGFHNEDRDIFFSSKGHDVPGLYAVLNSMGVVTDESLRKLRKLGGLDGHPNIKTTGIESNSGSLGMGISKGKGIAWAKQFNGRKGHVYVMTGDGELQEGQNYEGLMNVVNQKVMNMTVLVDCNKVQTDKFTAAISDLGDLEAKFAAFGWDVRRCDGHDFNEIESAIGLSQAQEEKPGIVILDTIKGKGIKFMEHTDVMTNLDDLYAWHSGAPSDEHYMAGLELLLESIHTQAREQGYPDPEPEIADYVSKPSSKSQQEFVAQGYGDAIMELAESNLDIVVLDGDLSADCRVRTFETTYPDRFIENGIAEQDMVSTAGGLATFGLIPFVNSFSSFLSSRANEQIYANCCEDRKVIYGCHFGGMIPAGPGKTHQSVRDIGLLGSIPNLDVIQPCSPLEAKMAVNHAVNISDCSIALRMNIGPSPRALVLPENYEFAPGKGCFLRKGEGAVMITYGPVMMHEALTAAEILAERGFSMAVLNLPWLNRFDSNWLKETLEPFGQIFVLDDHMIAGGLGERLAGVLAEHSLLDGKSYRIFGLTEYPECGTPLEVLRYHALDGESLANQIAGHRESTTAQTGEYTDEAPQ